MILYRCNICQDSKIMNYIWLAFITGLTTGGISCFAVQGGLLASVSKKWQDTAAFLVSKTVAYTILGVIMGFLGSFFVLSPNVLGFMQILAGLFMIATAGSLANIHPFFRHFVITPPKWAMRLARNSTKAQDFFAPAFLGFSTVLIPCGITQAMMALAVSTANPLYGAGIMLAFTLGTAPVFFGMGVAFTKLLQNKSFVYIASFAILLLGINAINSGQVLRGSVHTLQNYYKVIFSNNAVAKVGNEVQIDVTSRGYKADINTLKLGVPVKLTLNSKNVTSCARSFLIPSLGISKILPQNGESTIEFTPTKLGNLTYTCSMGMYTGQFTVVN